MPALTGGCRDRPRGRDGSASWKCRPIAVTPRPGSVRGEAVCCEHHDRMARERARPAPCSGVWAPLTVEAGVGAVSVAAPPGGVSSSRAPTQRTIELSHCRMDDRCMSLYVAPSPDPIPSTVANLNATDTAILL